MLSDYIRCAVDGDYKCLAIQGEATPEQLYFAWVKLHSDYCDLIDDKSLLNNTRKGAKVHQLALKINTIIALLGLFLGEYSEPAAAELRAWGYKIGAETWAKDIEKIQKQLGADRLKLELAQKEYEKGRKSGPKTTKADFHRLLLDIARHRGQHYRPEQINTYEFALMYKELREYAQSVKSKMK